MKSFASDNNAGIHPRVLAAIAAANHGPARAYGGDPHTECATMLFQELLGPEAEVFLVLGGTAANVLSLETLVERHNSVICTEISHINVDECGAVERYLGCKLIPVPTSNGKLTLEAIEQRLIRSGDQHHSQPAAISLTQSTEYGTVYSLQELRQITAFAHEHGLKVHMDGARISNAAATLGVSLREMTVDSGIDVLSFGGAKNGLMLGEAVVVFDPRQARLMPYRRKQAMQLASKMRFISAQFEALLSNGLWLDNARHANAMAQRLAEGLRRIPGIRITQPVQSNSVFAVLSSKAIARLQEKFYFYIWDERSCEVRWMTSWDTQPSDVDEFLAMIDETIA